MSGLQGFGLGISHHNEAAAVTVMKHRRETEYRRYTTERQIKPPSLLPCRTTLEGMHSEFLGPGGPRRDEGQREGRAAWYMEPRWRRTMSRRPCPPGARPARAPIPLRGPTRTEERTDGRTDGRCRGHATNAVLSVWGAIQWARRWIYAHRFCAACSRSVTI